MQPGAAAASSPLAVADGAGRDLGEDASSSHSDLRLRASIAEHAERYEDMFELVRQLVEAATQPLSFDERCLFAVACKHSVAPRRAAWRLLAIREAQLSTAASTAATATAATSATSSSSTTSSSPSSTQREAQLLSSYRATVQSELLQRLDDILLLLSSHLMPAIQPKLHRELSVLLNELHNRQSREESRTGDEAQPQSTVEDEIVAAVQQLNAKQPFIALLASSSPPPPAAQHAQSPIAASSSALTAAKPGFSPSLASALVFYYKMSGDMRRYCAELTASSPRLLASHALHAHLLYATAAALTSVFVLPASWPLCLSLALNRAVFEYEVNMQPERAIGIAKRGYDRAVEAAAGKGGQAAEEEADWLPEAEGGHGSDADSELIKRLLKDNLTLWSSLT